MTTININKKVSATEKLYKATMNGCVPMDNSGKRFFNKGVDKSLIRFPAWQRTETSNENKIKFLAKNFDINLMDPIILVAWPEENIFECVNGYHRYKASEIIGIDELPATIIFGPESKKERIIFEINLFLKQSESIEALKEIQMHDAKIELGDLPAIAIDELCKKYGITVVPTRGNRPARVLGSYNATYSIAKANGGKERLATILAIINVAGYMEEPNGLSSKIMLPLNNIIKEYPMCASEIGLMMRQTTPNKLIAKSIAKYPERGWRVCLTLYLQDWVIEKYGVTPRFDSKGKLIKEA